MPKLIVSSLVAMAVVVGATADANAHCQVPCGIYDDHARIHQMLEDVATIAKAVTQIAELAGKTDAQSSRCPRVLTLMTFAHRGPPIA